MITLSAISKIYSPSPRVHVTALDSVSCTIHPHEFVAILGPSGCGKSTLLYIIGLLEKATSGSIVINNSESTTLSDNEISHLRGKTIGFVFQQFNLISRMSVIENILLPIFYSEHHKIASKKEDARKLLLEFGIPDKENAYPNQLSGGQQQRVAIARALINDPDIIIADEPTGNLDSSNGKQIIELLTDIHKKGKTVILVTHDSNIASYAKRVIHMRDGRIIDG